MNDLDEPLLTTEDVSNYLQVDVVTVRRLVSRGELAAYRVGSEYRFSQQDLNDYLKRQYLPARPGRFTAVSAGLRLGPGLFSEISRALYMGMEVGREQPKPTRGERFTPLAAQALTQSDDAARQARSPAIEPLHLLMGLLRVDEGLAHQALAYFGITEKLVQATVAPANAAEAGPVPAELEALPALSADLKQALIAAVAEANRLKHDYVDTEHLLLGLLRDEGGTAADLLQRLNAPAKRVRSYLLDALKARRSE